MKMLTLSALVCAMLALTTAAALPEAEDEPGTTIGEALPDADDGNQTDEVISTGESHAVKRSTSCPSGWTGFSGRCFLYVPRVMTWAEAEKNCQSMSGNLASVHSLGEYHEIQRMIVRITHDYRQAWIGGSDAQQEKYWFWSDGTPFHFSHWCQGEPNNYLHQQHCLQINNSGQKCWDDYKCYGHLPSVCARKG